MMPQIILFRPSAATFGITFITVSVYLHTFAFKIANLIIIKKTVTRVSKNENIMVTIMLFRPSAAIYGRAFIMVSVCSLNSCTRYNDLWVEFFRSLISPIYGQCATMYGQDMVNIWSMYGHIWTMCGP